MQGNEGSIYSFNTNRWRMMKTDIILDRRAFIIVDLFRVTEVEARPLHIEDHTGLSTRRQPETALSRRLTMTGRRSYSSLKGRQFPCFVVLMLFTSKSGIICG